MVKLETLKKLALRIGVTGGIATCIIYNTIPYILNRRIKESDMYKEAMKMIKSHIEAVKYLGEPIQDGVIVVTNPELYGSDDYKTWFNVPVKGSKSVGNLYCETKKDQEKKKEELAKLELTVQSLPGYKLLIKRAE